MDFQDDINPLVALGFTELEAEIYLFLLGNFPATGYAAARELGKPAANVYNSLGSLELKGAVIAQDGDPKLYRPVSPVDLLNQMDRRYRRMRSLAEDSLTDLYSESSDDRVYRLRSVDQVMEKASSLLEQSGKIVLIDAFPETVERLREMIRRTVERGVTVAVKTYLPAEIEGAKVVLAVEGERILKRWPGHWLNIVSDGSRYMTALLSRDFSSVIQSVWTECPFLSWVHMSSFLAEIILTALRPRIHSGAPSGEIRQTLDEFLDLYMPMAPGYLSILDRIGDRGSE